MYVWSLGLGINNISNEKLGQRVLRNFKRLTASISQGYFSLDDFYVWAACNGQNSKE